MASQAWTGLCAIGTGAPFRDSKWVPDWTHPWIAKKQLFNSGYVKLMKRKMAFFRNLKWLIWNMLFINYWTLNVKNFYTSKYCIYTLLAEYGMEETYFGRLSLRSMESNEQWTWPQGVILLYPPRKCVVTLPWGSRGPFLSEMPRRLNGSQSKPVASS